MSRDAKQKKLRRQRERDFREKRVSRAWEQPKAPADIRRVVHLFSYKITHEPLFLESDNASKVYDQMGDDAMEALHAEAQEEPLTAIPHLQELVKRFPDVPMLYNWLSVAHQLAGHDAEAIEINRLNFERHPDYVFAIINRCNDLLDKGEIDRVTEILDGKLDLKLRYPWRNVFHASEFISFSYMVARYLLLTGEVRTVEAMLKAMEGIASDHPMTQSIRHKLFIKKSLGIFFPWKKKGRFSAALDPELPVTK